LICFATISSCFIVFFHWYYEDIAWLELTQEIKEVAFLKTKLDIEMINEHARTMKLLMMNLAMLDP